MIGEIMAVWFSSVHQLAMVNLYSPEVLAILTHSKTATFAIQDLCLHAQFVGPLRTEVDAAPGARSLLDPESLPLLDSFMKESARVSMIGSSNTSATRLHPQGLTLEK